MRRIHGRVPAWRWFGLALVLFALARSPQAQEFGPPRPTELPTPEAVRSEFERLLPLLAEAGATDDAICAIRELGPDVVPLLRGAVRDAEPTRLPRALLLGVLRTLGAMECDGLQALPELLTSLGGSDLEVHRQVLWSLTRIAPYATESEQEAIVEAWRSTNRKALDDLETLRLAECLDSILVLGMRDGPLDAACLQDQIHDADYYSLRGLVEPPHLTGKCLWIRAHPELARTAQATLRTSLREALMEDWLGRELPAATIERDLLRVPAPSTLASTVLALGPCVLELSLARAQLHSHDVDQRRSAVAWIEAEATRLTPADCADLCALLWDPDPSMALPAVRALRRSGRNALIALVALRHAASTVEEPTLRLECTAAADAITAAFAHAETRERETVDAFDGLLRRGGLLDAGAIEPKTWDACVRGLVWGTPNWVELVRASCLVPKVHRLAFRRSDWFEQAERVRGWLRNGRRGPCMELEFEGFRCGNCVPDTPLFPNPMRRRS